MTTPGTANAPTIPDPLDTGSWDAADTRPPAILLPVWWVGHGFVWLGGASWRDIGDRHERSSYQGSGFFVLLNTFIAWGLATLAAVGALNITFTDALPYTIAWGLFIGAIDRAISAQINDPAAGRIRAFWGYGLRMLVAVIVGFVVAETAALALFRDSIERTLNDNIQEQVSASQELVRGTPSSPAPASRNSRGSKRSARNSSRTWSKPRTTTTERAFWPIAR